jgi:hypothetical protein
MIGLYNVIMVCCEKIKLNLRSGGWTFIYVKNQSGFLINKLAIQIPINKFMEKVSDSTTVTNRKKRPYFSIPEPFGSSTHLPFFHRVKYAPQSLNSIFSSALGPDAVPVHGCSRDITKNTAGRENFLSFLLLLLLLS